MIICRVVGTAVSTAKDERLVGLKLLVVREATVDNQLRGEPFIAADTVGAGYGELVVVATGSSARQTIKTEGTSVEAAIIGILDSLEVDGEVRFRKSG